MRRHGLFAAIIFSLALWSSSALSRQQPSAAVQGAVVEAGSNTPIAKATVELRTQSNTAAPVASTRTEGDGRFYFPSVQPGTYRIMVSHPGHVRAEYGQRQPSGPGLNLVLAAGQRINDVQISMTPGGVISGRITDKGLPIGLADAVAIRATYTEGQLSFTPVLSVRTDDLGEYHLFWLPPGRYYIVGVIWDIANSVGFFVNPDTSVNDGFYAQRYLGRAVFMRATGGGIAENEAHIPIFYPNTPDPQLARIVDIQPGAIIRGLDIDASALPTKHIRGRVSGLPAQTAVPNGQPLRATLSMRSLNAVLGSSASQGTTVAVDAGGNFEISSAVAGRYMLAANAVNLTGRTLVEVRDRDLSDVVVSLLPGFNVTGQIIVERAAPATPDPALMGLRVTLRTDPLLPGSTTYSSAVQPNGSFSIPVAAPAGASPAGIPAGDYRILVTPLLSPPQTLDTPPFATSTPASSVYVKSIRMGENDVLNDRLHLESQPQDPITIVIGTTPGSIDGRVLDDRQQTAPGTTIALVHDNGLRYRVTERTAASDASGHFEFQNVAPGNYKLFAWESVERGGWQDPNYMRTFESRGVPVHVDESAKVSVDLRMIEK